MASDEQRDDSETVKPDARTSAQRPALRRSGRRRWYFRIAALMLPIALIAVTEVVLVMLDVGDDLGLFLKVRGAPELLHYQVNPRAEESYFAGRKLAGPEPRRFDLPRPDGVFRIVVVGGSTVLGFPYPPELSFPRQMEVLLNHQNDGQRFEVINAGMVAVNSFSVADVVQQCIAMQPDLIVVHTGHNEFYGPGGVASTTSMLPMAVKIRRLRLFQLLAPWFVDEQSNRGDLMEELPASVTISRDDPRYATALDYYRTNLERIVSTAVSANVPVVLTTVASNLSNHSPVSFLIPETLSTDEMERWRLHFDQGEQLSAAGIWQEAIEQFEIAEETSTDSSLLHYRMGQCREGLQQYPEALKEFELARDVDGCRFRAPTPFRDIVREVASQAANEHVHFVDSATQLADETGPAIPGANLFLEHVHYNLDGHRRLAVILGRFVQQQVLQRTWETSRVPEDSRFDELLGLLPEDRLSGLSYALRVLSVFPMTKTFDVNIHKEMIVSEMRQELSLLQPEQQEVFADLSLDDMATRLAAALADSYRGKQQLSRELYYRRCDQIRQPWDADVLFRLARSLSDTDQPAEAIEYCQRVLQLNPQHADSGELLLKLQGTVPTK
ncbi:MAG: tetratricopeptide repeat protein [Planctomycetaceae bacterium]